MGQQQYYYSPDKNKKLKAERGIGFDEVINWIEAGQIVAIIAHPKPDKYPEQKIYVIEHNDYAYNVPFIKEGDNIILKTIFPSRKATKKFLSTKRGKHDKRD